MVADPVPWYIVGVWVCLHALPSLHPLVKDVLCMCLTPTVECTVSERADEPLVRAELDDRILKTRGPGECCSPKVHCC